jgi:hypothetical protein
MARNRDFSEEASTQLIDPCLWAPCLLMQVTSLSTIGMLLRLSPPLLRRFFEPCTSSPHLFPSLARHVVFLHTSHPSKSSHHTTVPFVSGCAVENDEESGPVSGLSIVLGVIRGSRDKYALQAAAADVLRAAVEAGATS